MKPSPWPFSSLRRLSGRERRVVVGGVIVSAAALLATLIVAPLAQRWVRREAVYAAQRDQWTRLDGLARGIDRLRQTRDAQRRAPSADTRLVTGATAALAASALQGLLQRHADDAGIRLDRVDVASQPRPDRAGFLAIPAQLQGQGDVYALVDFLHRLQAGEVLLVVDDMNVSAVTDAAARDGWQTLLWTVRLHGLYRAPSVRGGGAGS